MPWPKGKKLSTEHKAKIGKSQRGRVFSLEHRAKLSGESAPNWKGIDAKHQAIHKHLSAHHPKRGVCGRCGRTREPGEPAFDYAFLRHPSPYTRNIEDYMETCRSCHSSWDLTEGGRVSPLKDSELMRKLALRRHHGPS